MTPTDGQVGFQRPRLDAPFEYVFPAIRGVQAGREYYTSMCPLRLIPKIFLFDEAELVPELRAQRILNKARIPEIARYITSNPSTYIFSAITASIDAEVRFEPLAAGAEGSRVGLLHIPMSARFIINDGQHRRAAIEMALRDRPEIGNETIAVVFFLDLGLEKCQQMFADLNRYAVRPSRSIGVLYDHRDEAAELARVVVMRSPVFHDVVEMERSTLSARSRKLFTLSAIYSATCALMAALDVDASFDAKRDRASQYWEEIAKQFPEWQLVRERKITAGEVRQDYLHSHGIVLQALGKAGNALLRKSTDGRWQSSLRSLKKVDWSRANTKLWEGRAMVGGRVQKAEQNVTLTTNLIKRFLKVPLSPEEQRVENAFVRGRNGK
jgi:DNA sulfur modification protein DndB